MGGRGTAFNSGAARNAGHMGSASDAKDFSALKQYMYDKHGIRVTDDLQKADFESVTAAAQGMEDIMSEFPQAAGYFHELNGKEKRSGAYASASYYGLVQLNTDKFFTHQGAERSYAGDLRAKFHPEGTTAKSIPVHEAGHILERALIDRKTEWAMMGSYAWNKSIASKAIIAEACKAAKRTPDGKGMKNAQLIESVSRYATKNRSETLAECVADYHANRESAKPLSREVWKILKRELG